MSAPGKLTAAPAAAILRRVRSPRGRIAGWGLGVLAAANAGVVVWLWLRSGGIADVEDGATLLSAAGRIAGLLGAYLALLELLLLARLPALERLLGFDRLTTWHRWCGTGCITLLCAHAVLITAGYTLGDGISLAAEIERLITGYPGVITAIAGLAILLAVGALLGAGDPSPAALRDVVLHPPLRLSGDRSGLQPPARHRHGVRRGARRAGVLDRALRRHARRAARATAWASRSPARCGTGCASRG